MHFKKTRHTESFEKVGTYKKVLSLNELDVLIHNMILVKGPVKLIKRVKIAHSFLTGEAKPRKSLVVGQSGVSKIYGQTSVSSKRV